MRVLVACEYSGAVRRAFRARGHEAWSCDLLPAEDDSEFHIQGNVLYSIGIRYQRRKPWDLMIAHPPCTRLTNSGVRWLSVPPPGRTLESMWAELGEAAAFYKALREAPIRLKAIENPIMHGHARALLGDIKRHIVQPSRQQAGSFMACRRSCPRTSSSRLPRARRNGSVGAPYIGPVPARTDGRTGRARCQARQQRWLLSGAD